MLQPPNPAVHIDFRPMQVKNDIYHPIAIATISFTGKSVVYIVVNMLSYCLVLITVLH